MVEGTGALYATAVTIGALHGVDPGHGWPVAAAYAGGRSKIWTWGLAAGAILGAAHLVSSFAVVAAFEIAGHWLDFQRTRWVELGAGIVLIAVGIVQWKRSAGLHHKHGHHPTHEGARAENENRQRGGLWGLAVFAFALGFVHEEEIAVLALCAGRASCWMVMATYAITVAGTILGLTLLSLAAMDRFRSVLDPWHERLPRISALILIAMGVLYATGTL